MDYYNNTPSPQQMYCPPDYVSPPEKKKLRRTFNTIGITLLCMEISLNAIVVLLRLLFPNAHPYNDDGVRVISLLDVLIGLCVPALTAMAVFASFCFITRYDPKELFTVKNVRVGETVKYIFIVLGFQHISMVITLILEPILAALGLYVPNVTYVMDHTPATYGTDMFIVLILAPIGEELLYRGIVLRCSAKISQRFAIFFSAFIFGIMHGNPYQFILGFLIGVPMAMITIKTGSIIPAILCHMANNLSSALILAIEYNNKELANSFALLSIPVFLVIGLAVFIIEAASGRMKLPAYTDYHKKRTFPMAFTSWSIIAVTVIYGYQIVASIKPIPENLAASAAEEAARLLFL